MTLLRQSDVIEAMASRHLPEARRAVGEAIGDAWLSLAGDLTPEEQAAVMWAISPLAVAPGGVSHRAHFAAVAGSLYPDMERSKAAARLRGVLRRPLVVAALAAIRAEDTTYLVAERAFVREVAFEIAAERAPVDYEPKDRIAHNKARLAAADFLVRLDALGPETAPPPPPSEAGALREKLVDRVRKLVHK